MNAYWNKILHAELSAQGITGENKGFCIYGFTNGRTSSSKELSDAEARELVLSLQRIKKEVPKADAPYQPPDDVANNRRRQLLAVGYDVGWSKERIIEWATADGTRFNDISLAELSKKIAALKKIKKQIKA